MGIHSGRVPQRELAPANKGRAKIALLEGFLVPRRGVELPARRSPPGRRPQSHGVVKLIMVRLRGLEPPPPCEDMDLNHARLPVPPQPPAFHVTTLHGAV